MHYSNTVTLDTVLSVYDQLTMSYVKQKTTIRTKTKTKIHSVTKM